MSLELLYLTSAIYFFKLWKATVVARIPSTIPLIRRDTCVHASLFTAYGYHHRLFHRGPLQKRFRGKRDETEFVLQLSSDGRIFSSLKRGYLCQPPSDLSHRVWMLVIRWTSKMGGIRTQSDLQSLRIPRPPFCFTKCKEIKKNPSNNLSSTKRSTNVWCCSFWKSQMRIVGDMWFPSCSFWTHSLEKGSAIHSPHMAQFHFLQSRKPTPPKFVLPKFRGEPPTFNRLIIALFLSFILSKINCRNSPGLNQLT